MDGTLPDISCEASRFLERVEINILNMKSEPSNGFSFIGHAEDQYTNFSVLFPLKDDSPKEIALCLKKHFISYFGPPVSFVSGSGKSLLPDVLCEVLECWKGDGLAFTLSDSRKLYSKSKKSEIIAKFVQENISTMAAECSEEDSWSDWLPEIMLRLNVCRHSSHHLNPYLAVFQQKTSALLLTEQQDLREDCDVSDNDVEGLPGVQNEDPRKKEILRYLKLQRGKNQQEKSRKSTERDGSPENKHPTSDTNDAEDLAALEEMVKQEKSELRSHDVTQTEENSSVHGNVPRVSKSGQEKQAISREEDGGKCMEDAEDGGNGPESNDPGPDGNRAEGTFQFFEIKRKLSPEDQTYIERLRTENPVITLSEIKLRLRRERNVEVHISAISKAIRRMTGDGFNQDELDSASGSQTDEPEEEQNTPRTNFLPQDDIFLRGMLSVIPLLPVEEIKKRLENERGLVVSSSTLNKKIAVMTNLMYRGGLGYMNRRQKPGMVNLPVSEFGQKSGKPVYRSSTGSSRSGGAGNSFKQTQAFAERYSRGDYSSQEVAASGSGWYKKEYIKRNVAATPVRDYTLDDDSFDSSDDDDDSDIDYDNFPVHFGEMQNENFEDSDIYTHQHSGFDLKQHSSETFKKSTKRSLQNIVSDLSQNPPQSKKFRQTGTFHSSFQSQYANSRKTNNMDESQEYSLDRETYSLKSVTLQEADLNFLKKLKYKNPLITLNEVKNRLLVERDLDVDIHCVSRAMKNIFMDKDNASSKETTKKRDDEDISFPYDAEEMQNSATAHGNVASSSSSPPPDGGPAGGKEGESLEGTSDNQNYSFADEPREINATRKLTFGDIQYIYHLKQDNPNITLKEIKAKLSSELHLDVHLSTISRALKKMKKEIEEVEKDRLL